MFSNHPIFFVTKHPCCLERFGSAFQTHPEPTNPCWPQLAANSQEPSSSNEDALDSALAMWQMHVACGVLDWGDSHPVTLETQVDQLCRYGAVFPEPGWDTSRNPAPSGICTELRIPRELMRSSTRTVAGWLWLLPPCWQCGIQKSLHQEEWRGVQIDVLLFLVAVVQFSSNIFRQVHPKNPGEIFYIHYLIYIYTYM